jgi:hypothetical protein
LQRARIQFSDNLDFAGELLTLPCPSCEKPPWIKGRRFTPGHHEWQTISRFVDEKKRVFWRVYGEDREGRTLVSGSHLLTIE